MGWGWWIVKRALRTEQGCNLERKLENAQDYVEFLTSTKYVHDLQKKYSSKDIVNLTFLY
jgi:hypothetical protein